MPIVRLFKSLPIESKSRKLPNPRLLNATLDRGFVFSPEVVANYSEDELITLAVQIADEIGLSPNQMNATFHKSWGTVAYAPRQILVLQQLIHYITTYGYEFYGVYSPNTVYIPVEKLSIPELEGQLKITVINGLTKAELKTKLMDFLKTGVALKYTTALDTVTVAKLVGITVQEIEQVRNKEVKCMLFKEMGMVPEDPVEFLRLMVYVTTGKTLLIKNKITRETIKKSLAVTTRNWNSDYSKMNNTTIYNDEAAKLFLMYGNNEKLASIFYRFKPLFLAFKAHPKLKRPINKIRKLAIKYHKPMKPDFLNNVTATLSQGDMVDQTRLAEELKKVNTFRKIRLAYALNFRTKESDAIMYRVRNGRSYSTDFEFKYKIRAQMILNQVLSSIAETVAKNVKGRKVYIPSYINYALPATEKQFIDNFPSGTTIEVGQDMIFGIHWYDLDGKENTYGDGRVDLDLSLIPITGGKIGWNGSYRYGGYGEQADVLFSGDITAAPKPKGATELFYIRKQSDNMYQVMLNSYNTDEDVPFKIVIGQEKLTQLHSNYMVNPNNVVATLPAKMNKGSRQKMLGLVVTTPTKSKLILCETNIGNGAVSRYGKGSVQTQRYLYNYYNNMIGLKDLLEYSGAKFVVDKAEADIDLSPEALTKDTILNLLK